MALGMAQLQIDRKKDAHCTIMVLMNLQPKPCRNQLLLHLTVTSQVRYNKYYLKTSVHDYPKYISLCRHVEASKSLVCLELICTNNDKKSFTSEKTPL